MWAVYKVNMLRKLASGQFGKDLDSAAISIADEYDACVKRGGDLLYGCNVVNGNKAALITGIKEAMKKGQNAGIGNFNLLDEIAPALTAYWAGATLAPFPNPLIRPGGWQSTIPAPGTILNLGPEPVQLQLDAARIAAEKAATKAAIDELKKQTVDIPPLGEINIYDTADKILKKKITDPNILSHPVIYPAVLLIKLARETKIPSPNKVLKRGKFIKFPKLPDRKKLIEEAKKKLEEEAEKQIKEQLIEPIKSAIITPIEEAIQKAVDLSNSIPSPKPTKAQIKKYVKDTVNGLIPELSLPGIDIPKIPTKEELEKMVKDIIDGFIPPLPNIQLPKIPTKDEIKVMVYEMIKDKIPEIPNFNITLPTLFIKPSSVVWINPFVNFCKTHMLTVGGIINVLAQYPPPATPAPAFIKWDGYRIPDGPPVPNIPIRPSFPSNIPLPEDLVKVPTIKLEAPKVPIPSIGAEQLKNLKELPKPPSKTFSL